MSADGRTICSEYCGNLKCLRNRRHIDAPSGKDRTAYIDWINDHEGAVIKFSSFKAVCGEHMATGPKFSTAKYMEDDDE